MNYIAILASGDKASNIDAILSIVRIRLRRGLDASDENEREAGTIAVEGHTRLSSVSRLKHSLVQSLRNRTQIDHHV
jgi:hypothetical protein